MVQNPPASAGDAGEGVHFLRQDDTLEMGMVTHSSILAWRIPWTEEPGELPSVRSQWSCTQLSN